MRSMAFAMVLGIVAAEGCSQNGDGIIEPTAVSSDRPSPDTGAMSGDDAATGGDAGALDAAEPVDTGTITPLDIGASTDGSMSGDASMSADASMSDDAGLPRVGLMS